MHQKNLNKHIVHIILFWLSGLLSGTIFSYYSADILNIFTHSVNSVHLSFFGLFIVFFMPLLLAAVGVKVQSQIIVFVVFFFKAFLHGYCLLFYSMIYQYNDSLLSFFLLFAENSSSILLFLFYFSVSIDFVHFKIHCILYYPAAATLVCLYYWISNVI